MQMATAEVLQEQILPRPVGVGGHAAVSEVSEEALGDSRHQASHAVGGDGGERSGSAMEIDQDRGTREQVAYGEQATVWADDAQVEYPRGGFHRSFAIEYVDEWSDGHGSADSYLSESGDFADTLDVTELEEQPLPGGSGAGIGRKRAWSVELQEGHSHRVPCAVDEGPSGGLSGGSECKRNRVISVVNSQVKEHGQTSRGKAGFDSPQGSEARHGEGGGRGSHIRTEGSAQGDGEVAEGGSAGREGIVGSKRWTCEGQDTWCCREQDEEDKSASDWECESDGDARLFADDETGSSSLRETCASPGAECGEAAARRRLFFDAKSLSVGVEKYDDALRPASGGFEGRMALHAWNLAVKHPRTKNTMRLAVDMPADMQALSVGLGLRVEGVLLGDAAAAAAAAGAAKRTSTSARTGSDGAAEAREAVETQRTVRRRATRRASVKGVVRGRRDAAAGVAEDA